MPWAVGLDELPPGLEVRNGGLERGGVAVGDGVIGDEALDGVNAVSEEKCGGAGEKADRGCNFLFGMDLGVGEASLVIDCGTWK